MVRKPSSRARAAVSITAENDRLPDTGTALANYSPTLSPTPSCALAQPDEGQRRTWGGARNFSDRVSYGLTDKQVLALMAAAQFAFDTGRVFQRHWTIHYGKAGIQPSDGARFVGKLLDLLSRYIRRRGGQLSAIWVRECASDKGEHVHILLHLTAGINLRNLTRRWIVAAGGRYQRGVSKVTIVGGTIAKIERNRDERRVANAENVARYMTKAASGEIGELLNLPRHGEGGPIVGKRWGRTNSLKGQLARNILALSEPQLTNMAETVG